MSEGTVSQWGLVPSGAHVGPLTRVEQQRLKRAESVIERGYKTFIDVGEALLEIRDDRLYRQTHETFSYYVGDRWGWPVSRAYQQITAYQAVTFLKTVDGVERMPRNELVARQLGTLLHEGKEALVVEAWMEAVETADPEPPTAAQTRKAVRAVRYRHSSFAQHEQLTGERHPDAPEVLPDTLFRDLQTVLKSARRNLRTAHLPDRAGLKHLDVAWRRRVRKEVDEVRVLLDRVAESLDEADDENGR